jgi:hypothetical protein
MRNRSWGALALVMLLGLLGVGLLITDSARADAGGWPTATPSPSPIPTWTFPPFPTWTPTPGWVFVTPPADQKSLPTGEVLSPEQILATLQTTPQAAQADQAGGVPGWVYAVAIILALALAGLIAFVIFRWVSG